MRVANFHRRSSRRRRPRTARRDTRHSRDPGAIDRYTIPQAFCLLAGALRRSRGLNHMGERAHHEIAGVCERLDAGIVHGHPHDRIIVGHAGDLGFVLDDQKVSV